MGAGAERRVRAAPAAGAARKGERGVALLIAVLATALLTITVMELAYSTQVSYRRAAHWLEARRARLAAESGLALATEVLSFDGELADLVGGKENLPPLPGLDGLDPRLAATDGFIDLWARCSEPGPSSCTREIGEECTLPLSTDTGVPEAGAPTGDEAGFFTVRIDDETGFYNVNRLSNRSEQENELERVARLMRMVQLDAAIVGPLTDWVDRDDSPLVFPPGAEASQYAADDLEPLPRNAPMATFQELGLVMGVHRADLAALRRVVTVLPAPADKINVNTAPLEVLQVLGNEIVDEGLLAALHAQRCQRPFIDEADLKARVPEIEATGMVPLLAYASQWFRVRSTARVGDTEQSIEALLFRKGAQVDTVYFLARRGANIDLRPDLSTADSPQLDLTTPTKHEGERS
jgi:general secretion pathway protein K